MIYGVFVGSMGHAAFSVLLPVIMTRWFHRHLGIVIGIYWAGKGIGPMIFAPLFRWLLETEGWQNTFTVIGLVLGGILAFFSLFIYSSPAAKGLQPYGAEDADGKSETHGSQRTGSVRIRDILKQPVCWQLMGIHHLGCLSHAVILAHVVSMATFKGIPGVEPAGVLAAIAGSSVISRFGFSVMAEVTRQVQEFLQSLASEGLFGPGNAGDACYVVCDDRVNSEADVHEGRLNVLVGLPTARPGGYQSFLVTHSSAGSRVRPARANRLPPGARMTVGDVIGDARADEPIGAAHPQRTVAQELFGYYGEPRPAGSTAGGPAIAPAAGRFDLDAITRLRRDLGGRGQRF